MRISIIQNDTIYKDKEKNIKKINSKLKQIKKYNPDLIVLPEVWNTGFSKDIFDDIENYVEDKKLKSLHTIKEYAKENKNYILAGTVFEKEKNMVFNTAFLFDRNGDVIGKYRKIHLYSPDGEDIALNSGGETPIISTEFGKIGILICYDIRFPELSRIYAQKGVDILLVTANFVKPKLDVWKTLLKARAIENEVYVIACNRAGSIEETNQKYFGHSMIVSPKGEVIEEAGEDEIILNASIEILKNKKTKDIDRVKLI